MNGQKIWTTDAHRATHMILAARTNADPDVRHGGISLFVLPMDTPGITVRPTMAMYGDVYCNIFLDDVRIPPSHLLGRLNGGWSILATRGHRSGSSWAPSLRKSAIWYAR